MFTNIRTGACVRTYHVGGSVLVKISATAIVAVVAMTLPARATPIHVDAMGTYVGASPGITPAVPTGTTITASVDFNVGPGAPFAAITDVSGTFSWDNGGPQVFNATAASLPFVTSAGQLNINFFGIGPTFGSYTVESFLIGIDVHTDPTMGNVGELILSQGTIYELGVTVAEHPFANTVQIEGDVSGTITAGVPEPSSVALLGVAGCSLLVLAQRASRRGRKRGFL